MAQLFSSVAWMLLTVGVAFGPDDPVGIDDAREDADPDAGQISIERARWQALREQAEGTAPVDELPVPKPWAAERQIEIERVADGVRVRVVWTLVAIEAGWWTSPLIGPVPGMRVESATWRGRDVGISPDPAGEAVALELADDSRGQLKLAVFIPGDQLPGGVDGSLDLWLMPAVRGELRLTGAAGPEGRVPELVVGDGQARRMIEARFWTGDAQLRLDWVDAAQPGDRSEGPLAVAQTAVGLTFGDGEVRGRARLSWLLRRGQLDRVSIDTAGLGRDLEVVGPNVHAWSRSGDRIDVELKEAADGRVDVDLRWTQGLSDQAEAKLAAPRITPQQAYRNEGYLQLARDGELEVLPQLAGWSPLASAELPDWAGGYIQGSATATYRHDDDDPRASFDLLRFVPLSGPPVVVDVAAYEIATTDEGRSLVQARYDVRNERASHLRVALPAGSRMLGVRVNGETATPTRDAEADAGNTDAWRIPLVRSLESVKGSLSFPVEVIYIGEADDWNKKESRELQLPALDAPVAVSRVRVYLPPNYQNRVAMGDFHRVGDFSEGEGITYGLGVGVGSAEVSRADELYRDALAGWIENDFGRAQSSLDQLGALGASNANIAGLQANLDLVQGRGEAVADEDAGGQSAIVSRRIKDQAKVRAADDKIALHETTREAERLEAQGQYEQAEQKLAEAQELGDRLAMLEQSESKEQVAYNQALRSSSARISGKKKRKVSRERDATKLSKAELEPREQKQVSVYDFEDDDVAGELLLPQGVELPVSSDGGGGDGGGGGGGRRNAPRATAAPEQPERPTTKAPAPKPAFVDPNAALAGPVATASAVTVHVPAVGEAVLYQYMLTPEGKPLTVHLEARRHKRFKPKSK